MHFCLVQYPAWGGKEEDNGRGLHGMDHARGHALCPSTKPHASFACCRALQGRWQKGRDVYWWVSEGVCRCPCNDLAVQLRMGHRALLALLAHVNLLFGNRACQHAKPAEPNWYSHLTLFAGTHVRRARRTI